MSAGCGQYGRAGYVCSDSHGHAGLHHARNQAGELLASWNDGAIRYGSGEQPEECACCNLRLELEVANRARIDAEARELDWIGIQKSACAERDQLRAENVFLKLELERERAKNKKRGL